MQTAQETTSDRQECINKLREMISDIHIAMLTTTTEGGQVRSRPMLTPAHEFDGDLWFFTLEADPKSNEIATHPQVCVTYSDASEHRFVALSGTAEIVQDRKRIELLWNDQLREWFPGGVADPHLALIHVRVDEAEYWHFARKRFGYVRSLLSGSPTSMHTHERLQWGSSE